MLNTDIFDIPLQSLKMEETKENNVIDIQGLTQIFNKGTDQEYRLFDNFNLSIPNFSDKGQLISIMGQSGCGKSYLLKVISGLEKTDSGEVKIYGKPAKDYGNIPMVFQQYSSYEWMTVLDNVALPFILKKENKEIAREKAMNLLKIVGLEDHYWKYAKTPRISGGQAQRLAIARCLACNSQIMFLDEATGALDIKTKREVQDTILKIFYESKEDPTILNVTHSVEEAAYLSNRVIILSANPCRVHKIIDIQYSGENQNNRRGSWILNTKEYVEVCKEITEAINEVCL